MSDYKVGDHVQVKLSGGRIVEATVKSVIEKTDGTRLQVSFGRDARIRSSAGSKMSKMSGNANRVLRLLWST